MNRGVAFVTAMGVLAATVKPLTCLACRRFYHSFDHRGYHGILHMHRKHRRGRRKGA